MKYNYQYIDNSYQRKLRKLLEYYAGFIISNKEQLLEGERLDLPNVAILKGGERMYDESNKTLVVYRINKNEGTVDEI